MNVPKPQRPSDGTYEILAKIGGGGMGSVYKVRHRQLEAVRVAKVLRPQLAESAEWQSRFLLEARRASGLKHRSIAQLHEFHLDPKGDAWMILEFIEGCTLADVLEHSGPPSMGLVLEVARQSLDVLGYLHARGLIHRDVAPDNLMLSLGHGGELETKLIDLGIAKRVDEKSTLTTAGSFMGKYRYASPEQFDASSPIDPRSDLYSLGVTLYQLATGRFPLKGKTAPELAAAHWRQAPIPFTESDPEDRVPERLREILLKSLEKDPEDRFANARAFAEALADVEVAERVEPGELARILASAGAASGEEPHSVSASTQIRLNYAFGGVGAQVPPALANERLRRKEALELLAEAEGEMAVGDYRQAVSKLHRALALDPDNEDVEKQLGLAEAGVQRFLKIETAVGRVEALLAEDRIDEAAKRLNTAVAKIGPAGAFSALQTRIAGALSERASKVGERLARAQRLWHSGKLEEALESVQQALALDAADPEGRRLQRGLAEAMDRHGRVARALEAITAELETSRLEAAQGLYEQATQEFGKDGRLETMRLELEKALEAREKRVSALLDEAVRLGKAGKLEKASAAARAALELDPNGTRTGKVVADLDSALERRRAAGAMLAEAREQLAAEDTAAARHTLAEANRLFGDFEGLRSLQEEIGSLETSIREREIERLVEEALGFAAAEEWDRVADRVRHVASLDPTRSRIGDRLDDAEAGLDRHRRAREALAEIRELLAGQQLDAAALRCDEALAVFGASKELSSLQASVQEAVDTQSRVQSHLQQAEELEDTGNYREAVLELHRAAKLDGRLEVEDRLGALRQLETRTGGIKKAAERVEDRLSRGDMRGADRLLSKAESEYGEDGALRALRRKLAAGQRANAQDRLQRHLADAVRWQEAGDLGRALSAIRHAVELDPAHAEAQRLLGEVQRGLGAKEEHRRQVASQLDELELELGDELRTAGRRPLALGAKVAMFAVALGVLAVVGWLLLSWSGEVRVTTEFEVPGLAIWMDGEDTGLATPNALTLEGRRGSSVDVALKRESEIVASTSFVLGSAAPEVWSPSVKVRRSIVSEPPGARVFVDGTALPRSAPTQVDLDADPDRVYEVRFELEGYETFSTGVRLGDWESPLSAELRETARPGLLAIEAPYSVTVGVEGRQHRGRTLKLEVSPGVHQVTLSARDVYYSQQMSVTVASGKETRVTAFPRLTKIWIFAVPSNAELLLDGRSAGALPSEVALVVGSHRFEFRWPDASFSDRVEIGPLTRQVSSDARRILVE